MGFLSGAYGKLMAGKLVRDLQYQMTSVQSRLRRVTREIGDMEKNMQSQERNLKAQMQSQMQASVFGAMSRAGVGGFDPTNMLGVTSGMTTEQYSLYSMILQDSTSRIRCEERRRKSRRKRLNSGLYRTGLINNKGSPIRELLFC